MVLWADFKKGIGRCPHPQAAHSQAVQSRARLHKRRQNRDAHKERGFVFMETTSAVPHPKP